MSPATVSATQRTSASRGCFDSTSPVNSRSTARSASRPWSSHSRTPPVLSAMRPSSAASPASTAWRSASTARPRRASVSAIPRWMARNRSGASANRRFSQWPRISGWSRTADPPPPVVDNSPSSASIDAIRSPAFRAPVTSSISSASSRSKSATSSTKSRSAAESPRHRRVSIHPAAMWSPPAAFSAPRRAALRWMWSASGQPAESAATAASSRRDSFLPKNREMSGVENRRSSAVSAAARPSSAGMAIASPAGRSRNAIPTCRWSGARRSSALISVTASRFCNRSTSSSASTAGALWRSSARISTLMRYSAWLSASGPGASRGAPPSRPPAGSKVARPARSKARARYVASHSGPSSSSSESHATTRPCLRSVRQQRASRAVLPKPPGACSTVRRWCVSAHRPSTSGRRT